MVSIVKASGQQEPFQKRKLIASLVRTGASHEVASQITDTVEKSISHGSSTSQIYRHAKKLLKKHSNVCGMKYSLKKALSSLGPSGYPFEKYFARVLEHYGYVAETNRIVQGRCVSHEVDIVAEKEDNQSVIECKYHSDGGKATDVKIALYVFSRFTDIKEVRADAFTVLDGWLVTNTRCTSEAVKYAECVGLKVVSWRYPGEESLERMIERKSLYPVTSLPSVTKGILAPLFSGNFVLAQDVAALGIGEFARRSGLERRIASRIKSDADSLCPPS